MVRALVLVLLAAMMLNAQQPAEPPPNTPDEPGFTDADGAKVLHDFAAGLEGHSLTRFLSLFDSNSYPNFPTFSAEIDSYFGRYEQFRVHYLLKQTTTEADGRGVMTVQMELEEVAVNTEQPVRHSALVRFELARSAKGWKIIGFAPREFLS